MPAAAALDIIAIPVLLILIGMLLYAMYSTQKAVGGTPLIGSNLADAFGLVIKFVIYIGDRVMSFVSITLLPHAATDIWDALHAGRDLIEILDSFITGFVTAFIDVFRDALRSLLGVVDNKPVTSIQTDLSPVISLLHDLQSEVAAISRQLSIATPAQVVVETPAQSPVAPPIQFYVEDPNRTAIDELQQGILRDENYTYRVAVWAADYFAQLYAAATVQEEQVQTTTQQALLDRDEIINTRQYIGDTLIPAINADRATMYDLAVRQYAIQAQVAQLQQISTWHGQQIAFQEGWIEKLAPLAAVTALGTVAVNTLVNVARNPCYCFSPGQAMNWMEPAVVGLLNQTLP